MCDYKDFVDKEYESRKFEVYNKIKNWIIHFNDYPNKPEIKLLKDSILFQKNILDENIQEEIGKNCLDDEIKEKEITKEMKEMSETYLTLENHFDYYLKINKNNEEKNKKISDIKVTEQEIICRIEKIEKLVEDKKSLYVLNKVFENFA